MVFETLEPRLLMSADPITVHLSDPWALDDRPQDPEKLDAEARRSLIERTEAAASRMPDAMPVAELEQRKSPDFQEGLEHRCGWDL